MRILSVGLVRARDDSCNNARWRRGHRRQGGRREGLSPQGGCWSSNRHTPNSPEKMSKDEPQTPAKFVTLGDVALPLIFDSFAMIRPAKWIC